MGLGFIAYIDHMRLPGCVKMGERLASGSSGSSGYAGFTHSDVDYAGSAWGEYVASVSVDSGGKGTAGRPRYHKEMNVRRIIAALLAVTLGTHAPIGLAQNLPDLGETAQGSLSPQTERRIAELIMRDIRRDPSFIDDPEVGAYLDSIGRRLVAVSPDARADFEFFGIRDPSINAFAMLGGLVGVNSGLILSAQSESEFAGVVAHEVAHVTQRHIARQLERQSQLSLPLIAAMLVGVLAARSNPQIAQAAIVGAQAAAIQASINYTRDFEREADRVGFSLLEQAGFDVNGMPDFFGRLQRATRLVESNAPSYLRTHPLTTERMADLQNRAAQARYRQRPDSLEFQLVRARLRAAQGSPREAVTAFETQLRDRRFSSEPSARYGLAMAFWRNREWRRAEQELAEARRVAGPHAMFETLGASIKRGAGQMVAGRDQLVQANRQFGAVFYVQMALMDMQHGLGDHRAAIKLGNDLLASHPRNHSLRGMLARNHAGLGERAAQHRQQAEAYFLTGALPAAIEQLGFARSSPDADFYIQSSIDARLREMRAIYEEEKKTPIR